MDFKSNIIVKFSFVAILIMLAVTFALFKIFSEAGFSYQPSNILGVYNIKGTNNIEINLPRFDKPSYMIRTTDLKTDLVRINWMNYSYTEKILYSFSNYSIMNKYKFARIEDNLYFVNDSGAKSEVIFQNKEDQKSVIYSTERQIVSINYFKGALYILIKGVSAKDKDYRVVYLDSNNSINEIYKTSEVGFSYNLISSESTLILKDLAGSNCINISKNIDEIRQVSCLDENNSNSNSNSNLYIKRTFSKPQNILPESFPTESVKVASSKIYNLKGYVEWLEAWEKNQQIENNQITTALNEPLPIYEDFEGLNIDLLENWQDLHILSKSKAERLESIISIFSSSLNINDNRIIKNTKFPTGEDFYYAGSDKRNNLIFLKERLSENKNLGVFFYPETGQMIKYVGNCEIRNKECNSEIL